MSQWIPWLSHFEVKVAEIDHQHRELFRMFNELCDATWDGKGKDSIKASIKFLAQYVVNHFATEEKFMTHHKYPRLPEHKKAHDDFTAEVTDFIQEHEDKDISSELVVSVIIKLGDWTRDHIRGMDQELGKFLNTVALLN
ncbi:MAG: hemerythrin family protein [Desulfomonile tiedjei]|uniref:Hemerythrin family protein n=1 Tax=Desulfomonile tiedjei TaxID=2358 RepID=A0A9D6V5H4_9BACT|nr:hemerythrin family protein [Desulfomonile tiedjei]